MANYTVRENESGVEEVIEADSAKEAEIQAQIWLASGDFCEVVSTIWIDGTLVDEDGEETIVTATIDPDEPSCSGPDSCHDWDSPHSIVGGIKSNPGVWGHGGDVIVREVCMHCGCERKRDTWAQRPDTGEQGLESVSYTVGKYADEVEAMRSEES